MTHPCYQSFVLEPCGSWPRVTCCSAHALPAKKHVISLKSQAQRHTKRCVKIVCKTRGRDHENGAFAKGIAGADLIQNASIV